MKLFDLSGKTAFVSGGSRGIGKAIALGLAEAGADVAVGARTASDIDAVVAQIAESGVRGLAVPLDVSGIDAIPVAVEQVAQGLGPIDILVNVAGTTVRQPLEEVEESNYDLIMNTNSKGPYFLCKAVRGTMVERGGGKIINVASLATGMGLPKITAYAASKGALGQMTKGLAVELGPHNIQVNALAPGFIMTDLNAHNWNAGIFENGASIERPHGGRVPLRIWWGPRFSWRLQPLISSPARSSTLTVGSWRALYGRCEEADVTDVKTTAKTNFLLGGCLSDR